MPELNKMMMNDEKKRCNTQFRDVFN